MPLISYLGKDAVQLQADEEALQLSCPIPELLRRHQPRCPTPAPQTDSKSFILIPLLLPSILVLPYLFLVSH